MVNKFEAVGISVSVIAMVLALFLIRVESTAKLQTNSGVDSQQAAVVLSGENTSQQDLARAIVDASAEGGALERMIIDDVVIGTGDAVQVGDTVEVHYIGTLQNGQQFDNSYTNGAPFTFTIGDGRVISGWEEGLPGMQVGGQRILVIPSDLAYGDKGFGPIPAAATLVFAIELLSIK